MLPEPVRAAVRAAGADPDALSEAVKPGPPRPVRRWVDDTLVVDLAASEAGRRLVRLEVDGRRWATAAGVPVPAVHGAAPDGSWLVGARAPGTSCRGAEAVGAALDAADRIAACPAPLPAEAPSTWRADRRTLAVRVVRSVAGGLPIPRFRAARAAAAGLADRVPGHGDLYRRNVLADGADVLVIDWEFLGGHPRWTDHVRLWSTLTDPADRAVALRRIEGSVPTSGHPHVAVLVRHLTLRLLAENLASPVRQRNGDDLAHARRMVGEGEDLALRLLS
ncbi:phosphotransferase [Phycicoccus duodecadis]|uniref:Phosphotransferase family enzyme n=1 Tax=Phycicoccus duodecadis TaxID=173053 RepID=A0A2N3YIN9_9MICO|nr:phosphotransferase [Phycicoccus duodecadis]PKW26712.1 phosphotransferase family enzyme [Phycicoccus duodecadis]